MTRRRSETFSERQCICVEIFLTFVFCVRKCVGTQTVQLLATLPIYVVNCAPYIALHTGEALSYDIQSSVRKQVTSLSTRGSLHSAQWPLRVLSRRQFLSEIAWNLGIKV